MEMLMNALLLLLGIVKGCVTRLTLQEWGYLLGVAFAMLRGGMMWYDNRTEQCRRTAIFERYTRQMAQRGVRQAWKKLRRIETKSPAQNRPKE